MLDALNSGSRLTANLKTMDGPPPSDRVPAVDHDRLFKELLTTFFFEFLDLFFPELAAQIDRESIEFLSQELFPDLLDGAEYQADIPRLESPLRGESLKAAVQGPGCLFPDSRRTSKRCSHHLPQAFLPLLLGDLREARTSGIPHRRLLP